MVNTRKTSARVIKRINDMREQELRRSLLIAVIALAVMATLFVGYYVIDRYVRVGANSAPNTADTEMQQVENAVRDNPQAPDLRVALAQKYLDQSLYVKAIDQATQVLTAYPDREDAMMIAGKALTHASRPQEAIAQFEALAKARESTAKSLKDPTLEAAYYFLGQNYNATGQHDKALTALESALKIDLTDADALYQAGLAAQATKQYDKAVEYYNRATRLVPEFTEVYGGLIDTYTALNQPDNANMARGLQAYSVKDYQTALTLLEPAIKTLPTNAQVYFGLALTYEKLNRIQDAYRIIQSAEKLDPNHIGIQQALGRIEIAVNTKK